MTSYEDTKVQLTINRMTEECYDNIPNKSSTELYLVSQDPTTPAKIDLDAQSKTDADISAIQQEISNLSTEMSSVQAEVSTLSDWTAQQIDGLIDDIQEVSSNLTHSIVRRWEYVEYDGLTFTAGQANSTISMQKVGDAPNVSLEYSTGNGWSDFVVSSTGVEGTTITLPNIGDQVVVRAKTTNSTFATDLSSYNQFVMTGEILASDSIMYLLKSDGDLSAIPADYCFYHLFRDCSALTEAPELPAMTLDDSCYRGMFRNTSLTEAPDLPATTLADSCYAYMFHSCSDLAQIMDELPVETLAESCYEGMFYHCTSLISAPALPSTTLAFSCYCHMFDGCTSLASAPELPATTLARACYLWMFLDCTSLVSAPELPATTLAFDCYHGMFMRCTSLENPPSELPATTMAEYCYVLMFNQCPMETAPAIKAETLATECFKSMFWDCTQLNEIRIAYTGNFSGQDVPTDAFANWVNNVAASGTFYYDGEDTTTGINAIPTGWTVGPFTPSYQGLKFTSQENGSTWSLDNANLEYSTDGGATWANYTANATMTLDNGEEMCIRARTPQTTINKTFSMSGKIAASGILESLLDPDYESVSTLSNNAFYSLFNSCTALTSAPTMNATMARAGAFTYLFAQCANLSGDVEFPNLVTDENNSMAVSFQFCANLRKFSAPKLESIWNLYQTFYCCTRLEEVEFPSLKYANTQQDYGLYCTFQSCSSLRRVDFGKIESFNTNSSTNWAFYGCTSLEVIDCSNVSVPLPCNDFNNMFDNTNSTFKVVVPDSLYSTWLQTGDWATGASHIVKASEYNNN